MAIPKSVIGHYLHGSESPAIMLGLVAILAAGAPAQPKAAAVGPSRQWAFTGAAWALAAVPLGGA